MSISGDWCIGWDNYRVLPHMRLFEVFVNNCVASTPIWQHTRHAALCSRFQQVMHVLSTAYFQKVVMALFNTINLHVK